MLGTHGQLQMPCSGSASEHVTEPDIVAVTHTSDRGLDHERRQ